MKQIVRIIGGKFRGKKLSFPDSEGLRPTPNRVRETLFNWLMKDIQGSRCLDAFAGSGALGLEACSRGADYVVLIEQQTVVYNYLKKILRDFDKGRSLLLHTDALNYLKHTKEQFDIIFLDPPFNSPLLEQSLEILTGKNLLSPKGLVYIESAKPPFSEGQLWQTIKQKHAGQVYYGLYQKISEPSTPVNL